MVLTYLNSIFVVCGSENLLNDQFPRSRNNDRLVSKVSMLEQNAIVFFVDANGVLDLSDAAIARGELCI